MAIDKKAFPVLVVGAGTMGSTIAQVFAAAGYPTTIADIKKEFLDGASARIKQQIQGLYDEKMAEPSYGKAVEENLSTILNSQIPDVAGQFKLVFEVVPEKKEIKHDVYTTLFGSCAPDCIICSNTSGMDVFGVTADIIKNPERFLITHWFNPPHLMKIIEIVMGDRTSEAIAEKVREALEECGKKPVVLKKFVPGFIVNRLATVVNRELYYMVDQGWISAQDAETALQYTDGLRWSFEGPLALWDFVGLEIPVAVAEDVLPSLCNDTTTLLDVGNRLIAEGKTGVKAGEGMLKYGDVDQYVEKRNRRIIEMTKMVERFIAEDKKS